MYMKICFVSFEFPPRNIGGAGTYAGLLVDGLKNRGVEVHTITRGNEIDHDQKIYRIPTRNTAYFRRLFFMTSVMDVLNDLHRRHKFDLVHFNEPHIVTSSPKSPVVCTFHSTQLHELKLNLKGRSLKNVESVRDLLVKNPLGHLWDIVTGRMSDGIICPCSDLVKLLKYCFVNEKKTHVIPNGIDPDLFNIRNCDTSLLDKYGLEKDQFILYIGRLYSLKGVHYLIEAFQNLKKEYKKTKLVIVGSGDFEPYLRKIAGGTDDILFMGYVNSLITKKLLYENCFTSVVPSIYETFPMVVLEAMACGKPIVASNVGGICSMIQHGKNGFLVKPRNVKGIELSLRKLYEAPKLRRRMGMLSRKLVEEEFTVDKMVDRTLKVYESVIDSSSSR